MFIKGYKVYLVVINRLKKSVKLKNRVSFVLANRHIVHVTLVVIGLLVVSANVLQAQEIKRDNYGEKSVLSSLVKSQEGELVEETAASIKPKQKRYIAQNTSLVGSTPVLSVDDDYEEEITALSGVALVKENVLDTETGARGDIIKHTVEEGELVGTIAERYGISVNTIFWANDLSENDYIKPGQELFIPPTSGVVYTPASGDTVDSIANKYNTTSDKIIEYNNLPSADSLAAGVEIIIPDGEKPKPVAPVENTTKLADLGSLWTRTETPAPAPAPVAGGTLQWPTTSHRISQYYHWRHHGIDVDGNTGDPIYSAKGGTVTSAGWQGGYGLCVIVNHGDGTQTLYGHLSKIYVSSGQSVGRGGTLGLQGNTGWSTGDHLHFEYIVGGSKVNPLSYF